MLKELVVMTQPVPVFDEYPGLIGIQSYRTSGTVSSVRHVRILLYVGDLEGV